MQVSRLTGAVPRSNKTRAKCSKVVSSSARIMETKDDFQHDIMLYTANQISAIQSLLNDRTESGQATVK